MAIPNELTYEGQNKEFQFRDQFVMPLLLRLGFGAVVNYHGNREFGRDVIFGDFDRFGHVVYYGMQIKYESSISLSDSHGLIDDAIQATHNPFAHPHTGRDEFISCFYIANAGVFSDQGRENFFSVIARKGIRDARLLDGNALLLLNRAASLNRNSNLLEKLSGLLQEVRVNRNLGRTFAADLNAFAQNSNESPFPFLRFRATATANYLNAPFPIPGLAIDLVDQYWQLIRMLNDLADSMDGPISVEAFRRGRAQTALTLSPQADGHGVIIERFVVDQLARLTAANPP